MVGHSSVHRSTIRGQRPVGSNSVENNTPTSEQDSETPEKKSHNPDALTRTALLIAAMLPWYALLSGTYGLYFYILLILPQAGRSLGGTAGATIETTLFIATLCAIAPLAALVLLAMPAGTIWAALRRPPTGLFSLTARAGCIASMSLSFIYTAIIAGVSANSLATEGLSPLWQSGLLGNAAILLGGMAATWKAWRWLHSASRRGDQKR